MYICSQSGVAQEEAEKQADVVWQVIEDSSNYSFNASHAVAVALDALYGAYLKAHYPLQYYTVLLENYAKKGDKDKLALIKTEMQRAFNIRLTNCRFRQDNRAFAFDASTNTITDALRSTKNISARVADELYRIRERQFKTFIDVLYFMEHNPAFNAKSIYPLIHMGYFEEFGSVGKLLDLYREFREGGNAFKKTLVEKSQAARLEALKKIEAALPEREVPPIEQLRFEQEYFGSPLSVFPKCKRVYSVTEVNTKFSPKLKLYTASNGKVGIAKVKKATFNSNPISAGDVITVVDFSKRPAYQYINGKRSIKPGVEEIWINEYKIEEADAS